MINEPETVSDTEFQMRTRIALIFTAISAFK